MPKEAKLITHICEYLVEELENIHNERFSNKIQKKKLPVFPTKKSLIDFVFSNSHFLCTDSLEGQVVEPKQIVVSRGTARDAVNALIDSNRIAKGPQGYEFVPHYERELENYPILNIAPKINITVSVPDNIIFLEVKNGVAESVAEYLSAQFFKGDIKFFPMGNAIMCVEVLPYHVLNTEGGHPHHEVDFMRSRIEAVLRKFDLVYPTFQYGGTYELPVMAYHDPVYRDALKETVKSDFHVIAGANKGATLAQYQKAQEFSAKLGDLLAEYASYGLGDMDFPNQDIQDEQEDVVYDEEYDYYDVEAETALLMDAARVKEEKNSDK